MKSEKEIRELLSAYENCRQSVLALLRTDAVTTDSTEGQHLSGFYDRLLAKTWLLEMILNDSTAEGN